MVGLICVILVLVHVIRNIFIKWAFIAGFRIKYDLRTDPICVVLNTTIYRLYRKMAIFVERSGAVVKHRTRDREVPGSIPTNSKCCFLEQETLSTLLSTGFYPEKKRATWKISTRLLNVLPSINKVDYYYYYYQYILCFCVWLGHS